MMHARIAGSAAFRTYVKSHGGVKGQKAEPVDFQAQVSGGVGRELEISRLAARDSRFARPHRRLLYGKREAVFCHGTPPHYRRVTD